jgi:septum formation protein|tara:strand:- start:2498 stop:3091 length:594 start_codon:yes stop_codon:yes gene_type:complete
LQKPNTSKIILGSSSIYRKDLLDRILDTYEIISPKIDENNYNSLCAQKHSQQIALKKIAYIAESKIDSIIICADQIGEIGNKTLTKPTSRKNALNQLINYSNKKAFFYTSTVIFDQKNKQHYKYTDKTIVYFDKITHSLAEAYLEKDNPMDCAGSFKVECSGSVLFNRIETIDPTALIGLPLIWVSSILKKLDHIVT